MIVIADTSPINYLVQIGEIAVLPRLYSGQILVPPSVYNEPKHPRAPDAVRRWINQPPEWLRVCASSLTPDNEILEADIEVGERDAILLAQELAADELIMDDLRGRRVAERRHLSVTGTIGVLRAAAKLGLLDLRDALQRLRRTNFRAEEEFFDRLIRGEEV
jgi:predicted nucleic acid-binding protein